MLTADLSREEYPELLSQLKDCSQPDWQATVRDLCRTDLWFLLRYVCRRSDLENSVAHPDWLLARCREVQAAPDGHLDIWGREHYKSTLITFGLTLQTLLRGYGDDPIDPVPEPTIAIFSHTRPQAKSFARQIRQELEFNALLKEAFPDILFQNPEREAPRWGDEGMIVRRRSNPKEPSLDAWGLVDGQPTGMHYSVMIYDDVVTLASVSSPDVMKKTTEAWEMSLNLGAGESVRRRMIGTRYHLMDTWGEIINRGAATPRIYPCTEDGTVDGEPVLRSREFLHERRRAMGPYVYSSQMLCNPLADDTQGFRREWLRYYEPRADWSHANRYMLVDPANAKKKKSDYTGIWVWALGPDGNAYLIDAVRDRLNLTERTRMVMQLHQRWRPKQVGYEQYGMQSDIEYLKQVQGEENYRFDVTPVGGTMSKTDRIRRLVPWIESGRVWLPTSLHRTLHDGTTVDLASVLVEQEILPFPVALHDDLLDAGSRIFDLEHHWPKMPAARQEDRYSTRPKRSWMAS